MATESDWVSNGVSEFYVSSDTAETSLSWYAARGFCMERSADLTSITSSEEQEFLINHLNVTAYVGPLWHGLNRLQSPTWSWVDQESASFSNWAVGFPVNDSELPWKCGYLEHNGDWKNAHCDSPRGFICKRPPDFVSTEKTNPTTVGVQGYCPTGFFGVVNSNKCFAMFNIDGTAGDGKTYDDAVTFCRSQTGGLMPDLACIANKEENTAILARIEGSEFGFWIGLRRETSSDNQYRWIDNSPVTFQHWEEMEPSMGNEYCTEIAIFDAGTWNDLPCDKLRGYACQMYKDPDNPITVPGLTTQHQCVDGYVPYWYACYKLVAGQPKGWAEAEALCVADGGHLTSIHSDPENSAVIVYLMKETATNVTFAWIGLEYPVNGSVYYWSDNWHVVYTNWGQGQPDRREGGGCVGIDQNGFWFDTLCSQPSAYVCKITTAPPQTTPVQMEGSCPENTYSFKWSPYGEYCYGVTTSSSTWDVAQTGCQNAVPSRPCNLVSIHDPLESKFVGDFLVQVVPYAMTFWIGLSKANYESSHVWSDSSEVEFTNWTPGEPNDADGSQKCVRAYADNVKYKWDDYYCYSGYFPYVCKVRKAPPPSTPPPPEFVNGTCPSNEWSPYGGDCYLFRPDAYVTWDEADQDCRAFGSFLVTILNKDENWFVHHRLLETTWFAFVRQWWIGLSKQKEAVDYFWADGSSLSASNYTNWMPGNPSGDSSRLCVDLHGADVDSDVSGAQWSTRQCSELRGYACRVKKGSYEPTQVPIDSGVNAGAVAGVVIASVVGVALVVVLSFLGYRWHRNRKESPPRSSGVPNVAFDNRSEKGDSKSSRSSDPNTVNYFGELETQDPASVNIGRLEVKD